MAKGLCHIALKTSRLKQTEDFYVFVLGLKVAFRHPPSMIFLTTPGGCDLINFVRSNKKSSDSGGFDHMGFKVTPKQLRTMEARMKSHGVQIVGRRGKNAFYINDPNGYQIEYYCD